MALLGAACVLIIGFWLADRIARRIVVTTAERITRDHAPSG